MRARTTNNRIKFAWPRRAIFAALFVLCFSGIAHAKTLNPPVWDAGAHTVSEHELYGRSINPIWVRDAANPTSYAALELFKAGDDGSVVLSHDEFSVISSFGIKNPYLTIIADRDTYKKSRFEVPTVSDGEAVYGFCPVCEGDVVSVILTAEKEGDRAALMWDYWLLKYKCQSCGYAEFYGPGLIPDP